MLFRSNCATFTIKIADDSIEDIKFYSSGCAISTASESLVTEMAKGKKISEAEKITPEMVFTELGGIIQTRVKCALLGLTVLKRAIEEYKKNGQRKTIVNGIIV